MVKNYEQQYKETIAVVKKLLDITIHKESISSQKFDRSKKKFHINMYEQ